MPNVEIYKEQGGASQVLGDGGTTTTEDGHTFTNEDGVGTVATATGLTCAEYGIGPGIKKTVFTIADLEIDITAGNNAGYGSQKLYDFPAGAIVPMGALLDLDIEAGDGDIADTAEGDVHLGTTAQTDVAVGSLVSTQGDICATTAIPALTSGAGTANGQDGPATSPLDGTGTAKDAYLNFLIDTGDIGSSGDTLTVSGTITLYWMNLGDY